MAPLTPEALTIVAVAAVAVGVVALVVGIAAQRRGARLEAHYRLLMQDAQGDDLAAALETYGRRLGAAEEGVSHLDGVTADINGRLRGALQHAAVLRFNAFGDAGGDQSFAIALLDDEGSGLVLSGLHSRDGVRVYAKPVTAGRSSYALSSEEESAIAEARSGRQSG